MKILGALVKCSAFPSVQNIRLTTLRKHAELKECVELTDGVCEEQLMKCDSCFSIVVSVSMEVNLRSIVRPPPPSVSEL